MAAEYIPINSASATELAGHNKQKNESFRKLSPEPGSQPDQRENPRAIPMKTNKIDVRARQAPRHRRSSTMRLSIDSQWDARQDQRTRPVKSKPDHQAS